jgi:ribonuclease E
MEENRNNRAVERRLKEALKHDRARIQVGRISHFGLMEMSRQRLRPGLLEGTSRPCPHCEGRGIVRSISSCGLSVLRTIEDYLQNKRVENITAKVAREVAFYVLNEKRDNLLALEHTYGISIFLVPTDDLKGSQTTIERAGERNIVRRFPMLLAKAEAEQADEAAEELDDAQEQDEADADAGESAEAAEADGDEERSPSQQAGEGRGRRRRRGRRGSRRGRDDKPLSDEASASDDKAGDDADDAPAHASGNSSDEAEAADEGGLLEARNGPGDQEPRGEDEARDPEQRRARRGRRDRWGRNRGERRNGRNGGERGEGRPDATRDDAVEEQDQTPQPEYAERREREPEEQSRAKPATLRQPEEMEPAPSIEVTSQPVEARKWTPPSPTVPSQGEAAPRKSGWWSRRS